MPPENVPSETVGEPSSGCSASKERSCSERMACASGIDGVLAQVRHRAVRGLPARDRVRPHDALVRDARVVRRRLGHQHRAARRPARPPRGPAPARPRSRSPRPRTARARAPSRRAASQPLRRDHDRRRPALHVARAAPEQAVAVGLAGERVDRPVGAPQRDGVEVAREAQRRAVTGEAGHQRGPPGGELVGGDREPGRLQPRRQQRRGLLLVTRWVDGPDLDELAGELDDVGAHRVPTGSGAGSVRCLRLRRVAVTGRLGPQPGLRPHEQLVVLRSLPRSRRQLRAQEAAQEPDRDAEDRRVVERQRAERRRRGPATPGWTG